MGLWAGAGLALVTGAQYLLDARKVFATKERFPEADRVICGDFEDTLTEMESDTNSYFVMVTRGHKQDVHGLWTRLKGLKNIEVYIHFVDIKGDVLFCFPANRFRELIFAHCR